MDHFGRHDGNAGFLRSFERYPRFPHLVHASVSYTSIWAWLWCQRCLGSTFYCSNRSSASGLKIERPSHELVKHIPINSFSHSQTLSPVQLQRPHGNKVPEHGSRARKPCGVLENGHNPIQKSIPITFTIVDLSFQQALAFLLPT